MFAQPASRAAISREADWTAALDDLLKTIRDIKPDIAFFFASADYQEFLPEIARQAWERSGAMLLIGCSGSGIIGPRWEETGEPAMAMVAMSLPGATLRPARFTQHQLESVEDPSAFRERLGITAEEGANWLVFADPFRTDGSLLIDRLADAYPGSVISGGLASPGENQRRTWVFLNGEVYGDGGVGLALGGAYRIVPVVSQGCEPIGEPWTITGVTDKWVDSISNRPAVKVLAETLSGLPGDMVQEARENLVAGLAADEYRHEFGRGDFLIRNIIGFEWERGALALAARPRVGQTIQFQMRDAATADLDLTLMLTEARAALGERHPVGAVLCSCNGRGVGLFGVPHHDAMAVERKFGPLPLAGLHCAGEIGPVGDRTFLHGLTVSLALIVKDD
jgi:small ligand-binding sensory domain FIST